MEENEDYEPIVEGSELYNHLQNVNFDGLFETVTVQNHSKPVKNQSPAQINTLISQDVVDVINLLLFSNLMLEEDASYLYSMLTTYQVEQRWHKWKHILLPGCILTAVCNTYIFFKTKKYYVLPIVFGSLSYTMLLSNDVIAKRRTVQIISSLLNSLSEIFLNAKKTMRRVNELSSNNITLEVTSKKDDPVLAFLHKKTNDQIMSVMKDLSACMLDAVSIIRETSTFLEEIVSKQTILNLRVLSTLTDEELGINRLFVNDEKKNTIVSLEVLKNIYILVQSDYLKLLGICLTPLVIFNDNIIFNEVDLTANKLLDVLNKMKFQYHCNFLPKQLNKPIAQSKSLFNRIGTLKVFNSLLRSLILESNSIESYLETNETYEDNHVINNLNNIEKKLTECKDYFKEIKSHFQIKNMEGKEHPHLEINLCNGVSKETDVQLPTSEIDVDKVYLFVNDKTDESDADGDDCLNDNVSPQLPYFVLSELKNALVLKKTEFQQRELEAAKRDNITVAQYEQFLNDEKMETNKVIIEKSANKDKSKQNDVRKDDYSTSEAYSDEGMSFQKMIAMRAAGTSLAWGSGNDEIVFDNEEEVFGESSDSD